MRRILIDVFGTASWWNCRPFSTPQLSAFLVSTLLIDQAQPITFTLTTVFTFNPTLTHGVPIYSCGNLVQAPIAISWSWAGMQ